MAVLETKTTLPRVVGDLFTMTEDEILRAASQIITTRQQDREKAKAAEIHRLFKDYVSGRPAAPHNLGKPQKLTEEEAILLFAMERNKYTVEADCPNEKCGGRWHGSAWCKYNAREGAVSMLAASRHDLLLSLWASVSGQDGDTDVLLTDRHMQGSLVRQQIRALWKEAEEQDRFNSLVSELICTLRDRGDALMTQGYTA